MFCVSQTSYGQSWEEAAFAFKVRYVLSGLLTAAGIGGIVAIKGFSWPQHWVCSNGEMTDCTQNTTDTSGSIHVEYECSNHTTTGHIYCRDGEKITPAILQNPDWVFVAFPVSLAALIVGGIYFLTTSAFLIAKNVYQNDLRELEGDLSRFSGTSSEVKQGIEEYVDFLSDFEGGSRLRV
ncbi:MAG: hypothetical protein WCK49_03740 [Myxococcaceae bacterium]